MNKRLIRLVYFSQNLMKGDRDVVAAQVERILATGRRNNARNGITGALLLNSGVFAQTLEGRREDVEATFKRIHRDNRHKNLQLLSVEPVETRLFPHWSMGFLGKSRADQHLFEHLAQTTGLDHNHFESARIIQMMDEIARDEKNLAA